MLSPETAITIIAIATPIVVALTGVQTYLAWRRDRDDRRRELAPRRLLAPPAVAGDKPKVLIERGPGGKFRRVRS